MEVSRHAAVYMHARRERGGRGGREKRITQDVSGLARRAGCVHTGTRARCGCYEIDIMFLAYLSSLGPGTTIVARCICRAAVCTVYV